MTRPALVAVDDLAKHFPLPRRGLGLRTAVRAVDGVSFAVAPGEVLGLVGESGSGKSTVGRLALRLIDPTRGRVRFEGHDITAERPRALRPLRRAMQMVFQDPYASLNPRRSVGEAIGEVLRLHRIGVRADRRERTGALLAKVGLAAADMTRMPREFSGGQRQRIAIARALAVEPRFLVADEPVSALDVSVQAGILALLRSLQEELHLAMLFISHDLSVVEVMADRVMVLYLGRVMEVGPTRTIFTAPRHPYTAGLLAAAPRLHGVRPAGVTLRDEIPSPANPPSGCVFRTRCPFAVPECATTIPAPRPLGPGHTMACLRDDLRF
ncbi:MAG: ATP-binding cassette domain-containing protein [Alphaproteobacteria bacterium]|nr:ATP-binding cassette domain-containing protein [Alphaproteobacteria bacterium]